MTQAQSIPQAYGERITDNTLHVVREAWTRMQEGRDTPGDMELIAQTVGPLLHELACHRFATAQSLEPSEPGVDPTMDAPNVIQFICGDT